MALRIRYAWTCFVTETGISLIAVTAGFKYAILCSVLWPLGAIVVGIFSFQSFRIYTITCPFRTFWTYLIMLIFWTRVMYCKKKFSLEYRTSLYLYKILLCPEVVVNSSCGLVTALLCGGVAVNYANIERTINPEWCKH